MRAVLAGGATRRGLALFLVATACAVALEATGDRPQVRRTREPAVAGQFYPGDAETLRNMVGSFLDKAQRRSGPPAPLLLAPHAGYVFSGQVAADSFAQARIPFDRVFIVTANHNGRARYHGVSLDDAGTYRIPGSEIPVSRVVDELLEDDLFLVEPAANSMHMIEVELPFLTELARRNGGFRFEIVPMVLGTLSDEDIERVAAAIDAHAGRRPLFVFSLDLSHYYPYDVAERLDHGCLDALVAQDRARVARCTTDSTDRNSLLLIMLELARLRGLEPELITYKNSGDVSGDRSRVVGYGAVVFRPKVAGLTTELQSFLLDLSRRTLEQYVRSGRVYEPDPQVLAQMPRLRADGATFVTLEKHGRLRGCIGSLRAFRPLWRDVRDNTIAAASRDPRFPPVTEAELPDVSIELSLLEPPRPLAVPEPGAVARMLRPRKDGVILEYRGRRSTYLPEVWEQLPEPKLFLSSLCRKQGSPPDCWQQPEARFSVYGTFHFGPG